MLKKLFVTAAAAAAVSVPLAGVAWADKPEDPGAGNQGVPDRAAGFVETVFGADALEGQQSGSSGTVAPGTAFKQGAKVPDANTPAGYRDFLNQFYVDQGVTNPNPNPDLPIIPGSVAKQFTHGCAQHSSGVCLP